jgi:hypothetical protein
MVKLSLLTGRTKNILQQPFGAKKGFRAVEEANKG